MLTKRKSLPSDIEFEIYDCKMRIDKRFYGKLINFYKIKPNTKIIIKLIEIFEIRKFPNVYRKWIKHSKRFKKYKKLFDKTKHLHKLNMELKLY